MLTHHLTKVMPSETSHTPYEMDIRVYYEDTDTGGVVYYANYLKFFERARTEWLRRLGVNQSELATRENLIFVVKDVELNYRKPARLDDLLRINSTVTRLGAASMRFWQTATRDGQLLCESSIQVCCIDGRSYRPAPFTPELKNLLEKAKN